MLPLRGYFLRTILSLIVPLVVQGCHPSPAPSDDLKTASVDMSQLQQAIQTQQCEQWCWAASISMIFAHHGFLVLQSQIVLDTYGAVVCLPANATITIARDLSRPYADINGRYFFSRITAAFDPANNIYNLNNAMIVEELRANRPLLYCNTHHAMVLYEVTYTGSDLAPNIQQAKVVDPWPYSPRTHTLTSAELYPINSGGEMTFLAAVTITTLNKIQSARLSSKSNQSLLQQ
jgi:hypothetical protein